MSEGAAIAVGFRRDSSLWAMRQHQALKRIGLASIVLAICRPSAFVYRAGGAANQLITKPKERKNYVQNIDWKGLLKAILKAALPFFLGGAIGVTASGCSSLQTPRTKTQTSAIYAFGLPAIVVTHDATQTADYSGGDTNETMQSNK